MNALGSHHPRATHSIQGYDDVYTFVITLISTIMIRYERLITEGVTPIGATSILIIDARPFFNAPSRSPRSFSGQVCNKIFIDRRE